MTPLLYLAGLFLLAASRALRAIDTAAFIARDITRQIWRAL